MPRKERAHAHTPAHTPYRVCVLYDDKKRVSQVFRELGHYDGSGGSRTYPLIHMRARDHPHTYPPRPWYPATKHTCTCTCHQSFHAPGK